MGFAFVYRSRRRLPNPYPIPRPRDLTNADKRHQAIPNSSDGLAGNILIRLAEKASALRMSDLKDATARFGEHGGGHGAGDGAAVFVVGVLGAGEDGGGF